MMKFIKAVNKERLHTWLEKKLEEFDERDASQEEVREFLSRYGYFPKDD